MPLLEIAESKKITALVTIEETTAKQIDQYAAFTKGSPDDVVQAALTYIFTKDKDFQKFCDENAHGQAQDRASAEAPGEHRSEARTA